MNRFQQLVGGLLNAAPDLGAGVARGMTADVLGTPVDTLNTIRQGLLMPAQAGNPVARGIVGLLGPVQQTGTSDYFAQQMGLPEGQGMAYEAGRMLSPSPSDLMSLARRAPSIQELITYHGTPHQFPATEANPLGEFDASKIGTGEGAQAYGHGLYLAESPDVARAYQNTLSKYGELRFPDGTTKNVQDLPYGSAEQIAGTIWMRNPNIADAKFALSNLDAKHLGVPKEEVIKQLDGLHKANASLSGHFYTVDLPDEMIDKMLDWDKPLSEQPKAVKKIIKKHRPGLFSAGRYPDTLTAGSNFSARGIKIGPDSVKNYNPVYLYGVPADSMTGQDYWHLIMRDQQANPEAASKAIKDLGIPGIKYFDGISRSKGEGTRNFVVFPGEEKKVKILKRD